MATAVLTRLAELRESYLQQRVLRRELSCYVTESELNDIEAALARAQSESASGTRQVAAILAAQRTAAQRRR